MLGNEMAGEVGDRDTQEGYEPGGMMHEVEQHDLKNGGGEGGRGCRGWVGWVEWGAVGTGRSVGWGE